MPRADAPEHRRCFIDRIGSGGSLAEVAAWPRRPSRRSTTGESATSSTLAAERAHQRSRKGDRVWKDPHTKTA